MHALTFAARLLLVLLVAIGPVEAQLRRNSLPPIGSSDKAMKDFWAGKPLPGMPDLGSPVYLMQRSVACKSLGMLRNPNIGALLQMRACSINDEPLLVLVLPPSEAQRYVEAHVFGAVRIGELRPKSMSDGSVDVRWVFVEDLTNSPEKAIDGRNSGTRLAQHRYFQVVELDGTVVERTGVDCCVQGAERAVKFFALELDNPVDVVPANPKTPEEDEVPEKGVKSLQLMSSSGLKVDYASKKGRRVRISCKLFHSTNGHHLTNVLCDASRIVDL